MVGAGLFGQLAPLLLHGFDKPRFSSSTNLNGEFNIPATYNAFLFTLPSVLLWLTGRLARRRREPEAWVWTGLAALAFFLMLDEYFGVHERTSDFVRNALGLSGFLYYAWVIPYGLFALVVLAALPRFLRRLPVNIRWGFLTAGTLYVVGALGLELFEAQLKSAQLAGEAATSQAISPQIAMLALIGLEEALEMGALVLLTATLFRYLQQCLPDATLRLSLGNARPSD